jgi:hypothetical protein
MFPTWAINTWPNAGTPAFGWGREPRGASGTSEHHTSSGHGTMVLFTVFIAIASATAFDTPSSVNG